MAHHELKIWPEHLSALQFGAKKAEYRRDDRTPPFAEGDTLWLRGWVRNRQAYNGTAIMVRVTHVARGDPIPVGYCMLSVERVGGEP